MKKITLWVIILLIVEFIVAAICGPHSCEWGNGAYFYSGLVIVLISMILPFFRREWLPGKRIGFSLIFMLAVVIVWVTGFMACDFRIMCRLF